MKVPVVTAALAAAAAALALTLGGCGFRLAGDYTLPTTLARPYLSFTDPYTDFAHEFTIQLKAAGAAVQADDKNATATITVSKDTVEQQVLSVSATNIPTEYLLVYTITFSVHGADKVLLAPQTINLSRDYSFEEQIVLAKQHEADVLRGQMARDLASIAMRRLTSLK
jgi:LPS-assembly lipoprotein